MQTDDGVAHSVGLVQPFYIVCGGTSGQRLGTFNPLKVLCTPK